MTLKTQMERVIHKSYGNIGGIVVQKKGDIVYEKYAKEYATDSTFHIFSVTKSIVSVLIGIAIEKGYIKSVSQKVLEFFPDYEVKRGEKTIQTITLKDMLTMTAPYKYKTPPYAAYFASEDWVKAALDLLGGKEKTGEFCYTPVIGPDIFSGILVNVTGQPLREFATEYLFAPLGIEISNDVTFANRKEHEAFYKAKNTKGWVADPNGVNTAGWGLSLTTVDMAKIGQLYLNGGVWEEKQLVSKTWIAESTKEQSKWEKLSYGYLWWVIDEKEHAYAAIGDGGNVIYVNEKKELVIAIASSFVPKAKDRIKLIRDYIEPVFAE